jgi:hypothetical protein
VAHSSPCGPALPVHAVQLTGATAGRVSVVAGAVLAVVAGAPVVVVVLAALGADDEQAATRVTTTIAGHIVRGENTAATVAGAGGATGCSTVQ